MRFTGVFSAEGEDWKRQRRLTAHALDAQHLRQFFPTLIKVTERLKNRWNAAADKQSAVDVQQDLMRYTVDVTTNLAFGYDTNTLEKEGRNRMEGDISMRSDRGEESECPRWDRGGARADKPRW